MAIFAFPKISLVLKDYLQSLIDTKVQAFSSTNTASGTASATLNQLSGTITFSTVISGNATTAYTLTNSYITALVMPILTLRYDPVTNTGKPVILSVKKNTGSLVIYIENTSATITNSSLVVDFIIA